MIFLLLLFIFALVMVFVYLKEKDMVGVGRTAFVSFMATGIILMMLFLFAEDTESDYQDYKYYDNPTQTQNLETLPFEYPNETEVYVSREKNSQGNSVYTCCIRTENGLDEKIIDASRVGVDVYVEYIDASKKPYFKTETKPKEGVLIKKPSFWFNFFGWLDYKDASVGDIVASYGTVQEVYTFYVPQGSLREVF